MIKLEQIYFDGQSYAKYLSESGEAFSQDEIDIANQCNFTPVDSISFEQYQPQTFCDIKIGDYYFEGVSINHLYTNIQNTNIQKRNKTILYPSHNPTPDPGGLY